MSDQSRLFEALETKLRSHYRFGRLIASSVMSHVFEARRLSDNVPVVLKIADFSSFSPHTFQEFKRRVGLCVQLDHPNLVHVLEAGVEEDGKLVFLVMERVKGPTIRQHFAENQNSLTIGAVIKLFHQAAAGIDTLHRAGIIHRDIKPDNVLISPGAIAKVSDYGLALGINEIEEKPEADVFGTPAYMAPEQVIGTSFGPMVDIYGFAMTIYVLLSRTMAYDVKTTRELVFAQINQTPVPLRRRNRSWPHELDAVLTRSLSKEAAFRHRTAAELVNDVEKALHPFTPFRLSSYFDGSLSRFNSGEIPVDF